MWASRAAMVAIGLVLAACSQQHKRPADEAGDRAALIALDQAYAENWARNDGDAVMGLFAEDAVIIPHDGDDPHVGTAAIREFWFPEGAPPVLVTTFEHRVTEASISNGQGVAWGRFSLAFDYEAQRYAYDGNFLLTARKREDGTWEITHLTWNDPPPTLTPVAAP